MAADILLYDADIVPVGRDQKQPVGRYRVFCIANGYDTTVAVANVYPNSIARKDFYLAKLPIFWILRSSAIRLRIAFLCACILLKQAKT